MGTLTYLPSFFSCNFSRLVRACLPMASCCCRRRNFMLNSRSSRKIKQQRIKFDKKKQIFAAFKFQSRRRFSDLIKLDMNLWWWGDGTKERKPQKSIAEGAAGKTKDRLFSRPQTQSNQFSHSTPPSATHSKFYFLLLPPIYQLRSMAKKFLTTSMRRFNKFIYATAAVKPSVCGNWKTFYGSH